MATKTMPSKSNTLMRLRRTASILAVSAALVIPARAISQNQLNALKNEYPNGVPGYIDWNAADQGEMLRRAEHLAETEAVMPLALGQKQVDDSFKKAKIEGFMLSQGVIWSIFAFNFVKWSRRTNEANEAEG